MIFASCKSKRIIKNTCSSMWVLFPIVIVRWWEVHCALQTVDCRL